MAEDHFRAQTAAFLAWFKAQPGTTFHESIEIKDFRDRGAGRGIGELRLVLCTILYPLLSFSSHRHLITTFAEGTWALLTGMIFTVCVATFVSTTW